MTVKTCTKCKRRLFKDNPSALRAAAAYLEAQS